MFRTEMRWRADGPTLKMEGRLSRDWAGRARSIVTRRVVPEGLLVDLTQLDYIDAECGQLLKWLAGLGAEFVADVGYAVETCERLNLPLRQNTSAGPKQRH
jgi:hypothetical protein